VRVDDEAKGISLLAPPSAGDPPLLVAGQRAFIAVGTAGSNSDGDVGGDRTGPGLAGVAAGVRGDTAGGPSSRNSTATTGTSW